VSTKEDEKRALDYHEGIRPGKIEVVPTKPMLSSKDLALAYTPGVAVPCLKIADNEEDSYRYTSRGNLVGVVSNGTAVLGLGNIGAAASKPVMEGKGNLFKRFADIDVFDIEVDEPTIEGMVRTVKAMEPTFGGINLEDIKAPECFEIERQLVEQMNIPVFHDDQHGTAIIASAGFINAVEISGKKIEDIKVVFSGAGAASIACAKLFFDMGVKRENFIMCDSKGVIYKGRKEGMNPYKEEFAADTECRTLADALKDADGFIGCSARGILTKEMVATMAKRPIIFAMANPDPEIYPHEVFEVRDDAIMATGRSDFPNQVNNVLGFPFIFRGALDVRATAINKEMKLAAVHALADLAKEEVTEEVKIAYGGEDFSFGANYLIPKPFDTRVLTRVTPAVAKAAIDSGVARVKIDNFTAYASSLEDRLGTTAPFMKQIRDRLKNHVKKNGRKVKMVFAEGANTRILNAVKILSEDGRIEPILLGDREHILNKMKKLGLEDLKDLEIIQPNKSEHFQDFYMDFHEQKKRAGVSIYHAEDAMIQENYFGSMMVKKGLAHTFMAGPTLSYPDCFIPIMKTIGTRDKRTAAGIFVMVFKHRVIFLADCTANINPTAEQLRDIAGDAVDLYKHVMKRNPRVAFLSFSNFGSNNHPEAKKVKKAVQLTKESFPKMRVDGEVQADVAVNKHILDKLFNFTDLEGGDTDILIFPDLNAANISYKLLSQLADCTAVGPLLVPMNATVNIIQRTSPVSEIVNNCILTALLSEEEERAKEKSK
tara:strand:+ start:143236 stop:145542 length:2307 start_codon:yes stop_codon:yes gene_type:complete